MDGLLERTLAAVVLACFYLAASGKLVAAMQQCGYNGTRFLRWYCKKENAFKGRFGYWATLSMIATYGMALSFSFLEGSLPLVVSAIPFLFFCILFFWADKCYALKVSCVKSGRFRRLSLAYLVLLAAVNFLVVSLCSFLGGVLVSFGAQDWVVLARYAPVSLLPLLFPFILWAANAVEGFFEGIRNKKFVKRAGQVLDESKALKIAVVGSYGKTSVKVILGKLLSVNYKTVISPASYNTPIGVAKTLQEQGAAQAEAFVFEMGARRRGDIRELCELVKPDLVVFTGVCAQHLEGFGSERNILLGKCECVQSTAKRIICGESLREQIENADFLTAEERAKCTFVSLKNGVKDLSFGAEKTSFTLRAAGEEGQVQTALLGKAAVENVLLATEAALALGGKLSEIVKVLNELSPIPHRLELKKENGVYILDDAYNANEKGAAEAIDALCRFEGKKYLVTPGIVETGVLNRQINGRLGEKIAAAKLDFTALVGGMQVKAVKEGYSEAGGEESKIGVFSTLEKAVEALPLAEGDVVLFLNDLPDAY